jgi:hypothetical protein
MACAKPESGHAAGFSVHTASRLQLSHNADALAASLVVCTASSHNDLASSLAPSAADTAANTTAKAPHVVLAAQHVSVTTRSLVIACHDSKHFTLASRTALVSQSLTRLQHRLHFLPHACKTTAVMSTCRYCSGATCQVHVCLCTTTQQSAVRCKLSQWLATE